MELLKVRKEEIINEITRGGALYYIRVWNKREGRWYTKEEMELLVLLETLRQAIEGNRGAIEAGIKEMEEKGEEGIEETRKAVKELMEIIDKRKDNRDNGGNRDSGDSGGEGYYEVDMGYNWWLEVLQKDGGLVMNRQEGINSGGIAGHRSLMGEIEWIKRIELMSSVKQYPIEIGGIFPCGLSLDENRNKLLDYVWIKKERENFAENIKERAEIVEEIMKARGAEGISEYTVREGNKEIYIDVEKEKQTLILSQHWLYLLAILQMTKIVKYVGERDVSFWFLLEDIIASEIKGNKTREDFFSEFEDDKKDIRGEEEGEEKRKKLKKSDVEADPFPVSKIRRIRRFIKRKQRQVATVNFLAWVKMNKEGIVNSH